MGIDEDCFAVDRRNVPLLEVPFVYSIQTCDVLITPLFQLVPVVIADRHVKPVIPGVNRLLRMMGCLPHDFFRYAADIDAGPTQRRILHNCDIDAVLCRSLRVSKTTAAAAYHN